MEEWTQVIPTLNTLPLSEFLKIIDDALCHGFEFKVEDGCIYTRQV